MKDIEKIIVDYFQNKPGIISVILFGSYARNAATRESDVDIAVLFERSQIPKPLTLIDWREEISTLIHKDVDLVCLNAASPIIGMQVYKNGKKLIERDARQYAIYQIMLFSDYAELKELRTPMERDILKRKYYDRP